MNRLEWPAQKIAAQRFCIFCGLGLDVDPARAKWFPRLLFYFSFYFATEPLKR